MSNKKFSTKEIEDRAREIRKSVISMVHAAKCGHPGGPLGLADIFAVLYFDTLNIDASKPALKTRDRLILSNGHVSAVRYAAMKLAGYWKNLDEMTFRQLGSAFQGHPSTRYLPEVENSSGSLGQGLSVAAGLSLGLKMQKNLARVYCCISDGECGEGMIWEAATSAVHYKAPVIAFMDHNGIQIDGKTKDVCDLGDLGQRFASIGWKVAKCNGHNTKAVKKAFDQAKKYDDGPSIILFDTILGKGVSFMEDQPDWHGKAPNDEQYRLAMIELNA